MTEHDSGAPARPGRARAERAQPVAGWTSQEQATLEGLIKQLVTDQAHGPTTVVAAALLVLARLLREENDVARLSGSLTRVANVVFRAARLTGQETDLEAATRQILVDLGLGDDRSPGRREPATDRSRRVRA